MHATLRLPPASIAPAQRLGILVATPGSPVMTCATTSLLLLRRAWPCWRRLCAVVPLGRRCLPGASVVVVGVVLWLCLSLVSQCSPVLLVVSRSGLWGAVCCFPCFAPVSVWCFLLLPAGLGLACVLPFCVVGLRLWARFPSWSVPFGVSCYRSHCSFLNHGVSL